MCCVVAQTSLNKFTCLRVDMKFNLCAFRLMDITLRACLYVYTVLTKGFKRKILSCAPYTCIYEQYSTVKN